MTKKDANATTTLNDARIAALKPVERIEIGQGETAKTFVERSCGGRTLRWVRETADGFEVFRTERRKS
jgi:hypothetical protein